MPCSTTTPHLHRDRQHIHAYLDEAEHALEKYQRFKDTVQMLSPLDVGLEDIEGYGEWKDSALRLADDGEAILADPETLQHPPRRPPRRRQAHPRPASNASTTPSAATTPPSVANDTNLCPKTKGPPNTVHNAAASSSSARRNSHRDAVDGAERQLKIGPFLGDLYTNRVSTSLSHPVA